MVYMEGLAQEGPGNVTRVDFGICLVMTHVSLSRLMYVGAGDYGVFVSQPSAGMASLLVTFPLFDCDVILSFKLILTAATLTLSAATSTCHVAQSSS
jgi:hypothetical protein